MRAANSKFSNEDRQIMGSMITKAKAERQLSNQDIANMTGFGASSVGRASRADALSAARIRRVSFHILN